MYPSLLGSTSSICFLDWPEEALRHVAAKYVAESSITQESELAQKAVDILVNWHTSVQNLAEEYYNATKNKLYITTVAYTDMLGYFKEILRKRQSLVESQINKYSNGVKCLEEAAVLVQKLSFELESMRPGLELKNKETEKTMSELVNEREAAKKVKEVVEEKEMKASIEKKLAEQLQQECQEQLSKALPMLEEAKMGLTQIKEKDLVEMRTYSNPTPTIKTIMEMILILLGRKIIVDEHLQGKKRVKAPNYWKSVQEMLKNVKKVRDDLQKYDKKKLPIPEDIIKQVKERLTLLHAEKVPVQQSSGAMLGVYEWVQAILAYDKAEKAISPKREALKEATAKVKQTTEDWQKSQDELKAVENKRDELEDQFRKQNTEKENLKQSIVECQAKLLRAQELTERLKGEKKSWSEKIKRLKEESVNLFGDIILSAGYATYLGPFPAIYRKKVLNQEWIPLLEKLGITYTKEYEFSKVLGNPVDIMQWHAKELPSDITSEENAVMLAESKKCPVLIDPQKQAAGFIMNKHNGKVLVLKQGDDYIRKLKTAISNGTPVIMEKVDCKIDSILIPLLENQVYLERGRKYIKLDDIPCMYKDDFRLYFVTQNGSNLAPQVYIKGLVLNFTVCQEAISDQLMHLLANIVERDTEEKKVKLILKNADGRTLKDKKESDILDHIKKLGVKILDDQTLINTLTEYRSFVDRIESDLRMAKMFEDKTEEARAQYKVAMNYCSWLYFAAQDLATIDHMYQFSMSWFTELYVKTIEGLKLREENKMKVRAEKIIHAVKAVFYQQISQCLFERHKLLFGFLLSLRIMQAEGVLYQKLYDFFLHGIKEEVEIKENPLPDLISENKWKEILYLSSTETNFWEEFTAAKKEWTEFITDDKLLKTPLEITPQTALLELAICKILCPDKVMYKIEHMVKAILGEDLLKGSRPVTLRELLAQTTPKKPIMLILTHGNDPVAHLQNIAKNSNDVRLEVVSLGQGQGALARKRIHEFRKNGGWVLLQNCHLYPSWMSELEDIVEDTNLIPSNDRSALSPEYRLWLTSASDQCIPVSVLQRSVKCTNEPAKGVKAGILRIYDSINDNSEELAAYAGHKKPSDWNKLFMGLAFFHSILLERTRYGSVGWNGICQFTEGDLAVSRKLLYSLLEESTIFPFETLQRITVEGFYGAHILDVRDEEYLKLLLEDFYNDNVIYSDYRFCSKDESYYIPQLSKLEDYIAFIEKLPDDETTELPGLNENVNHVKLHKEFKAFEDCLLALECTLPAKNKDIAAELYYNECVAKNIIEKARTLLAKLPSLFDMKDAAQKFPILYENTINTVLQQELERYNLLISRIRDDLVSLHIALEGKAEMNSSLEALCGCLLNSSFPIQWQIPHITKKGLLEWLNDLVDRIKVFQDWIETGQPKVFWLPAFWNVHGLLSALKVNFARAKVCNIDNVDFTFKFGDEQEVNSIGVRGIYLENAGWDSSKNVLIEAKPKERYTLMPTLWIKPVIAKKEVKVAEKSASDEHTYQCPLYKGSTRNTQLSSYESNNFILSIPMNSEAKRTHWIKRNVALLTEAEG